MDESLIRSQLEVIGILPAAIQRNLPYAELTARSLTCAEGILAANGAIVVDTGARTGRSPDDRFVVDEPSVHDDIACSGFCPCQ